MNATRSLRPHVKRVVNWHRPLTVNVIFMLSLVLVSAVGLLVDDRTLLGEPMWMKPLKFGMSFAAYGITLAWLLTLLTRAKRFGWWFGTAFAAFGMLDVGVIAFAAARGTFSHFNTQADLGNQIVQFVFSYGVPPLLIANLVIGVLVLFQRAGDKPLTWALRAGLALSSAGMAVVVVLIGAAGEPKRKVTDANGDSVTMGGAHGVGDPDASGMPITNWSSTGGDIRVPHFVGLHGIHVLLVTALVLAALATRYTWLRDERTRSGLVGTVALGYTGLFGVVTWQALRGQSLIHPDAATAQATAGVLLVTAAAGLAAVALGRHRAKSAGQPITIVWRAPASHRA